MVRQSTSTSREFFVNEMLFFSICACSVNRAIFFEINKLFELYDWYFRMMSSWWSFCSPGNSLHLYSRLQHPRYTELGARLLVFPFHARLVLLFDLTVFQLRLTRMIRPSSWWGTSARGDTYSRSMCTVYTVLINYLQHILLTVNKYRRTIEGCRKKTCNLTKITFS